MATVALPSVGSSRTMSVGSSLRATHALRMMAERFALWHTVERRIDVWASAGALAVAGIATFVTFAVAPF
ncbi:MAG TPA: hypothetical protein VM582_07015 [Candidatus Thermoplasmatota archaeon]|nr:hypothetical protein [Candidatus Thermoplasmatota archaeon]